MKRKLAELLAVAMLLTALPVSAAPKEPELKLMNATAYTGGTITASGKKPREGLCAVDLGHFSDNWCAIVYEAIPDGNGGYKSGELLWILECEDKGPADSGVSKGYTIDIYRDDLDRCQELMDRVYENEAHGKVFVQFIKAYG